MDNPVLSSVRNLCGLDLSDVSVQHVRSLDGRHCDVINKASLEVLENIRSTLNPDDKSNYPAYAAVLHAALAKAKPTDVAVPLLLSAYARFATETPANYARILPGRWCGAGRHAVRLSIEGHSMQQALSLILPIREAAAKISLACPNNSDTTNDDGNGDDNNGNTDDRQQNEIQQHESLVPLHADFLAVCIEAKCYDIAARWLTKLSPKVSPDDSGVDASDVLLVYYYSGIVHIALKNFPEALSYLRIALAVPVAPASGRVHELIVVAYKKYVLVHILVHGTVPGALKFCSYNTNRLRCAATEYFELGTAYSKRKYTELRDVENVNRSHFENDNNGGLVKQIVKSLPKLIVKKLTMSFVTMKIEDVALRTGIEKKEEAEKLLVEMISSGCIRGSIDAKEGVVRLIDEEYDGGDGGGDRCGAESVEGLKKMGDNMERCLAALRRIQLLRDTLLMDSTYIRKEENLRRQKNSRGDGMGRDGMMFGQNEDTEMEARDMESDFV